MRVDNLTLQQTKRIISNNYRTDPQKGHGKDYGVDEELLLAHMWALEDKKAARAYEEYIEQVNTSPDAPRPLYKAPRAVECNMDILTDDIIHLDDLDYLIDGLELVKVPMPIGWDQVPI